MIGEVGLLEMIDYEKGWVTGKAGLLERGEIMRKARLLENQEYWRGRINGEVGLLKKRDGKLFGRLGYWRGEIF